MTTEAVKKAIAEAVALARELDAPITDRLEIISEAFRENFAPYPEAVGRLVERLEGAGAGRTAPAIGEPMPSFLLPDETGRLVSLEQILAAGPVAITFHRGHWCPYCRTNAHALGQVYESLRQAGGQLVAITPERQIFTQRHKVDAGANFRILSDIDNAYAVSLNLAIWIGDEMITLLKGFGRDLPAYHGNDGWFLPIPATFVVNRRGLITARFVDPDYRRRMDIDVLSEALNAA